MNYRAMDRERLAQALVRLRRTVDITDEEFERMISDTVSSKIAEATEILHTLLCDLDHEDQGGCTWFDEAAELDLWDLPSHKQWAAYTLKLSEQEHLADDALARICQSAVTILKHIGTDLNENPVAAKIVLTALVREHGTLPV